MKFNGRNVHISPNAKIGKDVRIGDNTVIYGQVEIGDGTTICNDCVIGEPLSSYYTDPNYEQPETLIGKNALIRSHTIIYAGTSFGSGLQTGHRVTVRERSQVGNECRIGTGCDLQGHLKIGDHCQLHSNVHLCQLSELGSFVFVYPGVVFTNDRFPPSHEVHGPTVGNHTQIGVQSCLLAGVRVGEHCLIAAQAKVTEDMPDHSLVVGSPAARKKDVRELRDQEGNALYPWPDRFSRGMPWEEPPTDR